VGKSSFLRSITRADVDVQPYAFTTKSLFVGHFDYKYLRFQAIDTPGILDHPLEEMNTIEMQSITAIAHLRSAVLYFMDLSEHCGYSITAQINLFKSIRPLFANKLVFIVINKIDLVRPEELDPETRQELDALTAASNVELLQLSCTTSEGIMEVRNAACERLVADRIAQKLKPGRAAEDGANGLPGGRLGALLTRIHVAQPLDGVQREVFIPEAVRHRRAAAAEGSSASDGSRRKLLRDIEADSGGPGVYNVDLRSNYLLENDEWKHDRVPEVYDGKNVYDYIDPDIEAKLAALEEEEERLEAEGFYDIDKDDEDDEELEDADEAEIRAKAELIREKQQLIRNAARLKKQSLKNRPAMPRPATTRTLSEMEAHLGSLGLDASSLAERARARSQSRGRKQQQQQQQRRQQLAADADAMDVDGGASDARQAALQRMHSRVRGQSQSNRREGGITTMTARSKAERLAKLGQKKMNRMARQGEADRHIAASRPKHLVRLETKAEIPFSSVTPFPPRFSFQDMVFVRRYLSSRSLAPFFRLC
jgi:nucleolar GTP-binding protein